MAWVRLADDFTDHPKVVAAGPLAGWLFICGLTFANRFLTDGFIPDVQVRRLADVKNPVGLAKRLVEVGLWEVAEGGYRIHDYLDYQPSAARVRDSRAANAARQSEHRSRKSNSVTRRARSAESNALQPPLARADPGPGPVPARSRTPGERIDNPGLDPGSPGGVGGTGGADAPNAPSTGSNVPDDFPLTDEHFAFAIGVGVPRDRVAAETERFLDYNRARGNRFPDWQAAWRGWMRRDADFAPSRQNGSGGGRPAAGAPPVHPPDVEAALAAWEAQADAHTTR